MTTRPTVLEVGLDCDFALPCLVGTSAHDRGGCFHCHCDWLQVARAFVQDPDLLLDGHPFFPKPELGNIGIFLDSSSDRWGQILMKRHEDLQAVDGNRSPRALYAWNFLEGVQNFTRRGALRCRLLNNSWFAEHADLAACPVATLGELEAVAHQLNRRRIDDLDSVRIVAQIQDPCRRARCKSDTKHPKRNTRDAKLACIQFHPLTACH